MKNFMTRHLMIAALAVAATPVFAQPPGGFGGPGGPGGFGGPGGPRGQSVHFLSGYLNLNEEQKTQATAIFDEARTAAETVRGQAQSAQEALNAAIKANAGDAEIDRLATAVGAAHGQQVAIQAKARAKFYALLTADQKAKLDSMHNRAGGKGPGKRGQNFRRK